jgi:hypothetical protein
VQGPSPSLSQYPAASAGYVPPTYAGSPQPYARVPGPAALTAPPQLPQSGQPASGVAGVSMAPVAAISPPAGPGGPHQLPSLPQVPLPQGFPNPFQLQAVAQQQPPAPGWPSAAPTAPPGQGPGVVTVTGPAGYLPGLGYFGNQPAPGQPPIPGPAAGSPPAPVQEAASYLGAAPPPTAFPVLPGAIPQQAAQALPQPAPFPQQAAQALPQPAPFQPQAPAPQQPAPPNPFWLQLAWQLIQTPPVRSALGDRFQQLTEGEDRFRFLSAAAACLAGPDLQAAFKAMTAGSLDQSRFITLFADHLVRALGH